MRGMHIGFVVPLAFGLALAACGNMNNSATSSTTTSSNTMAQKSLYERLGGQPAIVAVVDDFVANVAADPKINARFAKTDIPKLKQNLVDQICAASGGPCTYRGKDMVTAHTGMNISKDEFNAMGGDMVKTLDKFNVPEKEKHEVLSLLGSMQGDVVGH